MNMISACTFALLAAAAMAVPMRHEHSHHHEQVVNGTNLGCPKWVLYKQCDSSWGSQRIGTSSETICQVGCAMTSLTMIVRTKGGSFNPGTFNTWLKGHGGFESGDLLVWGAVDKLGLITFQGIENPTVNTIISGLSQCHGIIANVRQGSHWVLLTGHASGSTFYVNDPGFEQSTYTFSEMERFAVYH